ncbi:zinc finger protein 182-like [Drosophila navojoa]|uniref:zinc finger protein 182-like n=1 Tax=Drosophila navojoa TaxID=7232 RepID=UPI0011BF076A|nr:zinc finger protein 182-like [Drosophila navojoa]
MLKNMCRVCGRYAAYKKSLRIFENKHMLWSIQLLTGLILENTSCLPDLICICCQTELREAIRFSERVIAAQQQLLSALTEEELQNVSEEYKVAVMEYASSSNHSLINKITSETQSEPTAITEEEPVADEELVIKIQAEEQEILIEENSQNDGLLEYNIKIDDELIRQAAETQDVDTFEVFEAPTKEQQRNELIDDTNEKPITEDYILPDKNLDEECAVLDRVLNDEIAAQSEGKKKRGRKRIGNLIFVCDECGNHISGRMAFELHCRRHRGDKQFECDVCQDRFCTSSELKRHIRRHTGERPFGCQYCGRCFTDYSTRLKHERTHTNERPYVCTSCGKAFTTAYILKNHMLIHSGERAFSCELCKKTFMRQTHLATHCRSRTHERNLEQENQKKKTKNSGRRLLRCVLCGKNTARQNALIIFKNNDILYGIQVLTGLILENAKCLPELICSSCQKELREAIAFCDKVIATQQELLLALTEDELKEYKTVVDEQAVNSCEKSIDRNSTEAQDDLIEESIIETNLIADDIIIEEQDKHDHLLEYDIIINDDTVVQEAEIDVRTLETIENFTDEDQYVLVNEPDGNTSRGDYMLCEKEWSDEGIILTKEVNDDETVEPQNTIKNKRGRKRHGNLMFICNECGINISGRVAFDLHCRRHRGEKQFECTNCQSRFCTSSELKSHMRRHTGERPFPCRYCDRYFADNSTRIKHERTHTNERPYACDTCGKAFTTTYILKNHMLTHSGERAFSCEPCNKTFRRHTHLVTHFRSRAHKRKRDRQSKEMLSTS